MNGLTTEEFDHWLVLSMRAASAGKSVGVYNNPDTRATFDRAIQALCDFEVEHNLDDKKCPRDWVL